MQENTSVLAESYDLFNSSKIFSNMLADIDLKHNLGPDEKPKPKFGKITYYRFEIWCSTTQKTLCIYQSELLPPRFGSYLWKAKETLVSFGRTYFGPREVIFFFFNESCFIKSGIFHRILSRKLFYVLFCHSEFLRRTENRVLTNYAYSNEESLTK